MNSMPLNPGSPAEQLLAVRLLKVRRKRQRRQQEEQDHAARVERGETIAETVSRLFDDPLAWIRRCVYRWPAGETLASYQSDSLAHLAGPLRRVALRKGRGAGGSATAALAVLWFVTTREAAKIPWKVITTAGSSRQLKRYLWPEIRLWAARLELSHLGLDPFVDGTTLMQESITLTHGQAFAATSSSPELMEGGHAEQILVLLDEAAAIPDSIWDSLEGSFASATGKRQGYAFALSKPATETGRFWEICSGKVSGWWPRHAKLEEAIDAGRVSKTWANSMAELWGETSALYQNHVLGNFATKANSRKVIQLADVERAVERGYELLDRLVPETEGRDVAERWRLAIPKLGKLTAISLDVGHGGLGRDPAAIARRYGNVVPPIEMPPPAADMYATEMDLAGRIKVAVEQTGARAICDAIGAAALVGRLREQKVDVTAFVASQRSTARASASELGFFNKRAEAICLMGERLHDDDSDVVLPDDPTLIGELCEPEAIGMTSEGKIQIDGKDEIAKRLRSRNDREDEGFSTNRADAVVMLWMLGAASSGIRVHQPAARELSVF